MSVIFTWTIKLPAVCVCMGLHLRLKPTFQGLFTVEWGKVCSRESRQSVCVFVCVEDSTASGVSRTLRLITGLLESSSVLLSTSLLISCSETKRQNHFSRVLSAEVTVISPLCCLAHCSLPK